MTTPTLLRISGLSLILAAVAGMLGYALLTERSGVRDTRASRATSSLSRLLSWRSAATEGTR